MSSEAQHKIHPPNWKYVHLIRETHDLSTKLLLSVRSLILDVPSNVRSNFKKCLSQISKKSRWRFLLCILLRVSIFKVWKLSSVRPVFLSFILYFVCTSTTNTALNIREREWSTQDSNSIRKNILMPRKSWLNYEIADYSLGSITGK